MAAKPFQPTIVQAERPVDAPSRRKGRTVPVPVAARPAGQAPLLATPAGEGPGRL
jgi:hypothetical protein